MKRKKDSKNLKNNLNKKDRKRNSSKKFNFVKKESKQSTTSNKNIKYWLKKLSKFNHNQRLPPSSYLHNSQNISTDFVKINVPIARDKTKLLRKKVQIKSLSLRGSPKEKRKWKIHKGRGIYRIQS